MNKRYVVGLGEVLWDVLPEGKKLGGAPANFAYHAGQFLKVRNWVAHPPTSPIMPGSSWV